MVQTNVGKVFLQLLEKHFLKNHKFHKIFNKNIVKVIYSCMEYMTSIIKRHNRKIIGNNFKNTEEGCNCRDKNKHPLKNKCLLTGLVYKGCVSIDENTEIMNYIGLTEGTFAQKFNGHQLSFRNKKYAKSTELPKHVWKLKNSSKDQNTNIKWSIIAKATPYNHNNGSKRCSLCLTEKLFITKAEKSNTLNKRSELISKCRHENKYYIMNYKSEVT